MNTMASRFNERPHTKLGWWAVGLAAASILLMFGWMFLPGGAGLSFLCGLAGAIVEEEELEAYFLRLVGMQVEGYDE